MEPELDIEKFEKKLTNLVNTQDSITALSKWCLNKRAAHKQIVKSWFNVLKQVKIENRLTLFYLANDVIQHSKRKNYEFVDSWGTSLQKATTLVRDDKVREKISRIFNIWEQRDIYTEDFIADLHGLLAINVGGKKLSIASSTSSSVRSMSPKVTTHHHQPTKVEDEEEFQLSHVVSSIRKCVTLESETDKNLKVVVKTHVPDLEKTRSSLKDRSHVNDVEQDIENAVIKYEAFMSSLNEEINTRKLLLTALDQAVRFYGNQRRDVKKVVYAYKSYGDRIKQIQSDLDTKIPTLTSPIPSPDINAPSPEPDNDFSLPSDLNFYSTNMNGFGSFLNNNAPLPFDPDEFYRESPPSMSVDHNSIQVIHSQDQQKSSAPLTDFYNSLIPSKLESYNPEVAYASSYQPPPPPPTVPPMSNYTNSSSSNYMAAPPPPPSVYNPSEIDYSSGIPLPPPSMDSSGDDYSWGGWNQSIETPNSPPNFERKGLDNSLIPEYIDENLRTITDSNDIDQRQLLGNDSDGGMATDVDHRNLISLTGSPGDNNIKRSDHHNPNNGSGNFLGPPPLEPPIFNKFLSMSDQLDISKPPMNSFQQINRSQRPPLLPTPTGPPRYNRNISMNSDSSRGMNGPDDIETVDMEMSDDDTSGMDNRSVGSSGGDHRDFSMPPNIFPLPHNVNLARPPPGLMSENDQRKAWIRNQNDSMSDDGGLNQSMESPQGHLGVPPPNFMSQNHRNNNFQGGFRGGPRGGGGNMMHNNSPYNNFRGGRGGSRGRGRGGGGFRGNFKGQGQW